MRIATRWCSRSSGSSCPRHRHMPCSRRSAPDSTPWRTSSRRNSALPWLDSHRKRNVAPSTGSSSTLVTTASTSARASGCSATSGAGPSVHIDAIASGAGSPLRTVTIADAIPSATRSRTSAADASSRRCASSTPRSSRVPSSCVERADHAAQGRVAATTDRPFRNEMRDRAERNRRRRVRRRDPLRAVALGRDAREHLAGEAGLADTGRAREHHAAPRGQGRGRQIELVVPSDQRPPAQVDGAVHPGVRLRAGPAVCPSHPPPAHSVSDTGWTNQVHSASRTDERRPRE